MTIDQKKFLKNFPCDWLRRDLSNQFSYFPIYIVRVRFQNQILKYEFYIWVWFECNLPKSIRSRLVNFPPDVATD